VFLPESVADAHLDCGVPARRIAVGIGCAGSSRRSRDEEERMSAKGMYAVIGVWNITRVAEEQWRGCRTSSLSLMVSQESGFPSVFDG